MLKYYVGAILPALHSHLMELGVELEALTFQWFLSIFTDTLAAEALFRVWDVILCISGSVFLFQVAIALLRLNEKALLACESAAEVYSYLNGGMIHQGISIDGLIRESDALRNVIKKPEVDKRRESAVKKELTGGSSAGSESDKGKDSVGSGRDKGKSDEAGSVGSGRDKGKSDEAGSVDSGSKSNEAGSVDSGSDKGKSNAAGWVSNKAGSVRSGSDKGKSNEFEAGFSE